MLDITSFLSLPLPSPDAPSQREDVARVRRAIEGVDAHLDANAVRVGAVEQAVAGIEADVNSRAAVRQSAPVYMVSGAPYTLEGQSVLSVSEQLAGQTFALSYNTEADYAQEDAQNGTDLVSGAFQLHNVAGADIDTYTKLLIHGDGPDGSTEIVDGRGITSFGTGCAYFGGSGYFYLPASYTRAFGSSQDLTIECWVRPTGASMNYGRIFVLGALFLSYHTPSNGFVVTDGAHTGTFAAAPDAWYHAAVVRTVNTLKLYINGVERYSTATTLTLSVTAMYIGGGAENFYGWIDEFRVSKIARYSGTFTPHTAPHSWDAETVHLLHFDDGHGSAYVRDAGKPGHEVALLGATALSSAQAKFGSTSLRFDGSAGCRCVVAYTAQHTAFSLGADDFTFSGWFYSSDNGAQQTLMMFGNAEDYSPIIVINADGQIGVGLAVSTGYYNVSRPTIGRGAFPRGRWVHVALTRAGASVYLFLDGTLLSTLSPGTLPLSWGTIATFCLGGRFDGRAPLNGFADEVRLKRGVAEWTSDFTPPTVPHVNDDRTVLLLHFDGAHNDKVTLDSSEFGCGQFQMNTPAVPSPVFNGSAAFTATPVHGSSTSMSFSANNYLSWTFSAGDGNAIPFNPRADEYFCFEGWFQPTALTNDAILFGVLGVGGSWGMSVRGSGAGFKALVYDGVATTLTAGSATVGVDVHVALVRESRGYLLYINGQATAVPSPNKAWTLGASPSAIELRLGATSGDGSLSGYAGSFRVTRGKPRYTSNFTAGTLVVDDDTAVLWVFEGSVGQKWVKDTSRNCTLVNASGNGSRIVRDGRWIARIGTTPPKISTAQAKFGGGSLAGGNGGTSATALSVPYSGDLLLGASLMVLDFWLRAPSASLSSDGTICCFGNGGGSYYLQCALGTESPGRLRFSLWDGTSVYSIDTSALTAVAGGWAHFAFVRTSTAINAYKNGVLAASTAMAGTVTINNANRPFLIGSRDEANAYSLPSSVFLDEFRLSIGTDRGWTGPTIPIPSLTYGQQYAAGPFWVHTLDASRLDLSAFSGIDAVSVAASTPPGTSIKYAVSFDGRATWEVHRAGVWTTVTLADLDAEGMTASELQAVLLAWGPEDGPTLDVAASLKTTNPSFTPTLDAVTVTMDEYVMLGPVTDYAVKRKKAAGVQSLTLTRVKPGNALHVIDYI